MCPEWRHISIQSKICLYRESYLSVNSYRIFIVMMKTIVTTVCLLLFLAGCSSSEEKVTKRLVHQSVSLPEMMMGSSYWLQKLGDEMIIMDYMADSLFHRVDLRSGKYLGMFGAKGQGPDEFIHPYSIHRYGKDGICCYDDMRQEVRLIRKDSLSRAMQTRTLLKRNDYWAFDVIPYGNWFIANGCFNDLQFGLFDKDGRLVEAVGELLYKDEEERKIDPKNRAMAYQGTLRITEQGKVAFAANNHKIILLYRIAGGRLTDRSEIIDWYGEYMPDLSVGEGTYSVVHNGRLPMAYRDLAVTEDCLYALYSGRSFKDYGLRQQECPYVYVYDWSGRQLALYELDLPIQCLCVDEEARRIYGIANNPDPELVYFDF